MKQTMNSERNSLKTCGKMSLFYFYFYRYNLYISYLKVQRKHVQNRKCPLSHFFSTFKNGISRSII